MRVLRRLSRVVLVSVIGTVLALAGVVMLFIPGPGLLAIAAGLAVLAREFDWAQRLLARVRARIRREFHRRRASAPAPIPDRAPPDDERRAA